MRQPGQYIDSVGNPYAMVQMQSMPSQRMEEKSNNYQGRADHLNSENENLYVASRGGGQWRWERAGSSHIFNEGQGADPSRSYYQGQRSDPRLASDKQGNDLRSQPREEEMEIGYEDNLLGQSFEGLEQRFYDDIMKLAKEQNDAEVAEIARHRERVNAINAHYEEQLATLRVRYDNRRDEFLRRESHERQQQYQRSAIEQQYADSGMGPSDPHAYGAGQSQRANNTARHFDSYRDRARFSGGNRDPRDPGFEPRGQHPGGRVYGSGSRYY